MLLSISKYAELKNLHRSWIYKLISANRLPYLKIGGYYLIEDNIPLPEHGNKQIRQELSPDSVEY